MLMSIMNRISNRVIVVLKLNYFTEVSFSAAILVAIISLSNSRKPLPLLIIYRRVITFEKCLEANLKEAL